MFRLDTLVDAVIAAIVVDGGRRVAKRLLARSAHRAASITAIAALLVLAVADLDGAFVISGVVEPGAGNPTRRRNRPPRPPAGRAHR